MSTPATDIKDTTQWYKDSRPSSDPPVLFDREAWATLPSWFMEDAMPYVRDTGRSLLHAGLSAVNGAAQQVYPAIKDAITQPATPAGFGQLDALNPMPSVWIPQDAHKHADVQMKMLDAYQNSDQLPDVQWVRKRLNDLIRYARGYLPKHMETAFFRDNQQKINAAGAMVGSGAAILAPDIAMHR